MAACEGLGDLTSGLVANERIGSLLRAWRRRRRWTRSALAREVAISARHLGRIESGRLQPNRQVLMQLGQRLEVPLHIRNIMLAAAGFTPVRQQRHHDEPAEAAERDLEMILAAHDPSPAMVVDRHWVMLSANKAVAYLLAGAEPMLLRPPVNLLRLCLHPAGLACRIVNLMQWRSHVIARLHRQIAASEDTVLSRLLEEIGDYPLPLCSAPLGTGPPTGEPHTRQPFTDGPSVGEPPVGEPSLVRDNATHGTTTPFQLVTIEGTLSFFSTTTLFSTCADIAVSEMTIEAFLPADQRTVEILRRNALRMPMRQSIVPRGETRPPAAHA